MSNVKIETIREELNKMIEDEVEYTKIYQTSVELDFLIVQYYNSTNNHIDSKMGNDNFAI